jgi:hypothetical protein
MNAWHFPIVLGHSQWRQVYHRLLVCLINQEELSEHESSGEDDDECSQDQDDENEYYDNNVHNETFVA